MGVTTTVETPICVRWDLPDAALRVPGRPAAFSFERRVLTGACEFGPDRGRRQLSWRLEPGTTTRLLAQVLDRQLTAPVDAALVEFEAPLLSAVGGVGTTDGACLAAVSADGDLHVLRFSRRGGALVVAHRSAQLADAFSRHGSPTAVELCGGAVCVGTAGGAVLALNAEAPDADACVELKGSQSLTQFITSLVSFGPAKTSAVVQLFAYNYLDRCFVCSTHDDCTLRFWDVERHALVHTAELQPPDHAAKLKPILARAIEDPVDAAMGLVFVYFCNAAGSDFVSPFSITIEQRGDQYLVSQEVGSRLNCDFERIHDMQLVAYDRETVAAWLFAVAGGKAVVKCTRIVFLEASVEAAHRVVLAGSDVAEALEASSVRVAGAVWENVSALLLARAGISVEDVVARAFWNAVAHPAWFSLGAAQAAAAQALGVAARLDGLSAGTTVKDLVRKEWRRSGGGISGLLKVWLRFVDAYARELDEGRALLGFAGVVALGRGPNMPVLARGSATLTALAPGSAAEEAPQGGELVSQKVTADRTRALLVRTLNVQRAALGGRISDWLLLAAVQLGADATRLVGALVKALQLGSRDPTNLGSEELSRWRSIRRLHSADVSSLGGTSIDLAGLVEGAATEEGAYQGGTKLTAAGVEDPTPASDALLSRVHEVSRARCTFLLQALLLGNALEPVASAVSLGAALHEATTTRLQREEGPSLDPYRMIGSLSIDENVPKRLRPTRVTLAAPLQLIAGSLIDAAGRSVGYEAAVDSAALLACSLPASKASMPPWLDLVEALAQRGHFETACSFLTLLTGVDDRVPLALEWARLGSRSRDTGPGLVSALLRTHSLLRSESLSREDAAGLERLGRMVAGRRGAAAEAVGTDLLALALDVLEARGLHDDAVSVACVAASEASPGDETQHWHRVVVNSLRAGSLEDAYVATISSDPASQSDDLQLIVQSVKSERAAQSLVALPLADIVQVPSESSAVWSSLFQVAVSALRARTKSDSLTSPANAFQILYRLLVHRGCFQSAADCMVEYALRLQDELEPDVAVLRLASDSLHKAAVAARMVDEERLGAAVEAGVRPPEIAKELARVTAKLACAVDGLGTWHTSDKELVDVLLSADLHEELVSFALAVFEGSERDAILKKALVHLGTRAARCAAQGDARPHESLRSACELVAANGPRLHSAAARGVYEASAEASLPPWLETEMGREDLVALAIEYDRPLEAWRAANILLDELAAVPVRSACFPHDLLSLLAETLERAGHETERASLERRLRAIWD